MIFFNGLKPVLAAALISGIFIFWWTFSSAAGPLAENLTGDPALKSVLEKVKGNLSDLSALKENAELTDEEKNRAETELRKMALLGIISLSVLELEDLAAKLSDLKGLDGRGELLRAEFKGQMEQFSSYYNGLEGKLAADLSLDEVKAAAGDLKKWREEIYNPLVSRLTDFVFIYSERQILDTASDRLEKITGGLAHLKSRKLAGFDEIEFLLGKAAAALKEADDLNIRAEDVFWNASSSPAATSTAITVKDLIRDSLGKVKSVYRLFLKMSDAARKIF